jgi:hypothetical protein
VSTSNLVAAGIWATLAGGTALTAQLSAGTASIFRNQAPKESTMPYVVFSPYSGGPQNITPSDMREPVYFVRAYGASAAAAAAIDVAASALLHLGTLTVTGYTCYSVRREQDIELVETPENSQPVFMAGGLYRISLDA